MPIVFDNIELPGSTFDVLARVDVYLVADATDLTVPGVIAGSDISILDKHSDYTNGAGYVQFNLRASSLITPGGTYYVWETHFKDGRVSKRYIEVPNGAGPYHVADIEIESPAVLARISYINVLDYGADPTGVASSSAAFAAALVKSQSLATAEKRGPAIGVPPGVYSLATSVVLNDSLAAGAVTVIGLGDEPQAVRIKPPADGITPAFAITHFSGHLTLQNMAGFYGRFAVVKSSDNIHFHDVWVSSARQGVAPVQVFNTFWFSWTGQRSNIQADGSAGLGHGRTPALELIGDSINYTAPAAASTYLVKLEDLILFGGGVRLIQSGDSGSGTSFVSLIDVSAEGLDDGSMLAYEEGRAYYDAVLTAGSTTLTITDVTGGGFVVGDVGTLIRHPLLPLGTTIAARVSATQVTLSAAAIQSCAAATVTVFRLYSIAAAKNLNMVRCAVYDSTGDHVYFRAMQADSHGAIILFDACQGSGVSRFAHNYSSQYAGLGYIYATALFGFPPTGYLVEDAAGVASPKGISGGLVQNLLVLGKTVHLSGTGSPEGVTTAAVGSTFRREDGGAGTTLYVKESGTGNTGWTAMVSAPSGINFQSGNYTLVASDAGKTIWAGDGSARTLTVPADASVNFPIGTVIWVVRAGSGTLGVSFPGSVATATAGNSLRAQYSVGRIQKISANFWLTSGDFA